MVYNALALIECPFRARPLISVLSQSLLSLLLWHCRQLGGKSHVKNRLGDAGRESRVGLSCWIVHVQLLPETYDSHYHCHESLPLAITCRVEQAK